MRDWLALKPLGALAAVTSAAVLVQWGLVSVDRASLLVPPPEHVAEQFVKAVKEHNYGAARHALTRGVQAQVAEADLEVLAARLERRMPALEDARGVAAVVRANAASAAVEIRTDDGRRQKLEFRLERQDGLWKVSSIEPAQALAASGR